MYKTMARIGSLLMMLMIASCQSVPTSKYHYPAYNFSDQKAYKLDVADVVFVDAYRPPFTPPNVEHQFPVKPYIAVKDMIKDRVRAVGKEGMLRVTVVDASVVEEKLPLTPGLAGIFVDDQSERYKGRMEVMFEVIKPGSPVARAKFSVHVARSGSVPKRASLIERNNYFYDFTLEMLKDTNPEIDAAINQYFTPYLADDEGYSVPRGGSVITGPGLRY